MDPDSVTLRAIKPLFAKDNTAIIVVDKQGAYFDPKILAKRNKTADHEALARIDKFIKHVRDEGVPIIWTQMIEDIDDSPANIKQKMMIDEMLGFEPIRAKVGSEDIDFFGVEPLPTERIIKKLYYNAFADTGLHEQLKHQGIKSLVLVGGFASRCVLGTTYGANGHGYHVWVPNDLVANPLEFEKELKPALSIIDGILGYTYNSDKILSMWQ